MDRFGWLAATLTLAALAACESAPTTPSSGASALETTASERVERLVSRFAQSDGSGLHVGDAHAFERLSDGRLVPRFHAPSRGPEAELRLPARGSGAFPDCPWT